MVTPAAKYKAGTSSTVFILGFGLEHSSKGTLPIATRTDKTTAKGYRNGYMFAQLELRL